MDDDYAVIAFYIYADGAKLTLGTDQLLDWHEMVHAPKDQQTHQYIEKIVGTVVAGNSTRTLRQGVYAIYSDKRIDYSITGRYEVRAKSGKDDWPLPPPVAPDVFKNATHPAYRQAEWDNQKTTFMKLQGESTAASIVHSVQVGKLDEGVIVPEEPITDTPASLRSAPRKVRALLIGADQLPDTAVVQARTRDAVNVMEGLLQNRLGGSLSMTHILGTNATYANVEQEMQRLVKNCLDDELVVLLYSGHATRVMLPEGEAEAWRLYDQPLDDLQLAKWLVKINPKAELVVVVDCCYAAGFFDPLREKEIAAIRYTRSFLLQLSRAASTLGVDLPALILAAACLSRQKFTGGMHSDFVRELREAITGTPTYQDVKDKLEKANSNRQTHRSVLARPDTRLQTLALRTP